MAANGDVNLLVEVRQTRLWRVVNILGLVADLILILILGLLLAKCDMAVDVHDNVLNFEADLCQIVEVPNPDAEDSCGESATLLEVVCVNVSEGP